MSNKLGYVWYSENWISSNRVFRLTLAERGFYRELIDRVYLNRGAVLLELDLFSRMFSTSEKELEAMIEKFKSLLDINGEPLVIVENNVLTIPSCKKRMTILERNRVNGAKGGRPPKKKDLENTTPEKPKNPNKTQSERQIEYKIESKKESEVNKPAKPVILTPIEMIDLLDLDKCQWNYFNSTNYQRAKELLVKNNTLNMAQLKYCSIAFNYFLYTGGENKKTMKDWSKHFRNWLKLQQDLKETILEGKKIFEGKPLNNETAGSNEKPKSEISEEQRAQIARLRGDVNSNVR